MSPYTLANTAVATFSLEKATAMLAETENF
jgi:hypothetical protein